MQIPESVEKLTNSVVADPFVKKDNKADMDIDNIILTLKRSLDNATLANFETGVNFYKINTSSEKQIIKNYLALFSEAICAAIKNDTSDVNQSEVIESTKSFFEGSALSFDSFYNNLTLLFKENYLLDARSITYIILGYALTLIKKVHNSRNEN